MMEDLAMYMTRRSASILSIPVLAATWLVTVTGAADLKVIKTQTTKDVVVRLLSESGLWSQGKTAFVLEFTSTKDRKPADAGKVTLSTSMSMPGMAPMVAGAAVEPEGPGRYRGSISFPDRGDRQVTVAWDGPTGKGSTKFTIPVRS
jgi:hypothetical protein